MRQIHAQQIIESVGGQLIASISPVSRWFTEGDQLLPRFFYKRRRASEVKTSSCLHFRAEELIQAPNGTPRATRGKKQRASSVYHPALAQGHIYLVFSTYSGMLAGEALHITGKYRCNA
ncbi:MAG: hypothetical protein COV91_01390 [Candidatus Taylorbacteria bacterium CG11_big_fil_rev_8_21_14_0_20_46_11]|uniref:Uncharacterized protein n=1 Tax=Candidatus Taylorbacteria bacterium CG11_big_fil_rev_8_21_14_0_20_46_11 TaxID=1975025 RepID=A0A2H0KCJ1_9BACT|nr:MAG: hypothetical protein COV91_01390 [Candidatus Taylorbacteria bacterium CG11_big_fil_rev_8_21_14_0_20_46_11]